MQLAGEQALLVLPAAPREQLLTLLEVRGIPFSAIDVASNVRTNVSVVEPDGTTTKLNEPGGEISPHEANSLRGSLLVAAERAQWVVLSGSLPPGVPTDLYGDLIRALRQLPVKIALDTSDGPLEAAVRSWPAGAPDFFKPNLTELATACGLNARSMQAAVEAGDLAPVADACRTLVQHGAGSVLASLASSGGVLATREGVWSATTPAVEVVSKVAAGDATVAGYLLAERVGGDPEACLRNAMAYGAATVGLDGSGVPAPEQTNPNDVEITQLA